MRPNYLLSVFSASVFIWQASAQIQTAGNLLVNIDPGSLPAGPVLTVPNSGTAGGVFQATGLVDIDQPVVVNVGAGTKAIMFDGHNFMEHVSAPDGAPVPAPASLTGNNPPCSIEVWVVNPTLLDFDCETMVSWGTRGGALMAFGYATEGNHGAVDHWGANLGWNPTPTAGQWHHLVYTYDGSTTRIYADGAERGSLVGGITTSPTAPITLAAQRNADGTLTGFGANRGSLSIGKLRIHSAALTAAQVANNYNTEKAGFVTAPAPLTARPTHRYSFNNAAVADAVGATVNDTGTAAGAAAVIKGAPGTASFTGTKIHLTGGPSASAPYVDLPNGLVSSLSSTTGGPGEITLEGWVQVTGRNFWIRFFDFGSGTSGELTDVGGDATGQNYFMLAQPNDYRDWAHVEVQNTGFGGGPGLPDAGSSSTREFGLENGNGVYGLKHFAVTWKESTGEIVVYENGIESTRFITDKKFNMVDDVNDWLGRSNWTPDQNLQGDYDEFRVYNHVLTPAEVINDFVAGPDAVAVEPGTLQALHLNLPRTTLVAGTFAQASLIGDFQNVQNVDVTTRSGVSYQSDTPGVATVSPTGEIQAVGAGNAKITASLSGVSTQQTIIVTPVAATLRHRYSFNDPAGSATVADAVGGPSGAGTLQGNATLSGTQVVLDGVGSYVELPPGVIGTPPALTIETWASIGQNPVWVRLFDFGDQNGNNAHTTFFLSPHDGGGSVNMSLTTDAGNRFITRPGPLDGQNNVHIVAELNPDGRFMGLYINGVLVASNNDETIPISAINDLNSWIGRSMYAADAYLVGSVDEFRIYDGTLTPQRIALDLAAGPNLMVTEPGSLQSVSVTLPDQIVANTGAQAQFTGNFANVQNVNLFLYGAPSVSSDKPGVLTVNPDGSVRAVSAGTATLTFSYGGKTATKTATVNAATPTLRHRYSFNDAAGSTTAADSVAGGAGAGNLQGNATIANGDLVLDGALSYLDLPTQLVSGYYALSVEAWADFSANGGWSRMWDFGSQNGNGGGETSIFFSPHTGPGGMELTTFTPGRNDHVSVSTNLDNTSNTHIVGVYFPAAGYQELYINGVLVGSNRGASIPLSAVNDVNNWIGRSMFNADPYVVANIHELRIYEGPLSASDVAADFAAGPNALPVSAPRMSVSKSGSTLTISWPDNGTAFTLQSSSSVTGPWNSAGLSVSTQNGQKTATDTIPPTGGAKFYRLIQTAS
jgi:hypothetical protein